MCKWNIATILCDLVLALVINTSAMLIGGAEIAFQSWYPGVASAFSPMCCCNSCCPFPGLPSR